MGYTCCRSLRATRAEGYDRSEGLQIAYGIGTMSENAFRAAGYSWRLHCGRQVIEQGLRQAVDRAGAKRAFVVCSPSVNRRTDTVRRIAAALGDRYAGVYDGIEKDLTYASVRAATQAATRGRSRFADRGRWRQRHRRYARGGDLHGGTG